MLKRFHEAGLFHQSIYRRNILVQSGPLDFPPEKRSADTLSFRLIDFGRTVAVDFGRVAKAKDVFQRWCMREQEAMQNVWNNRGDDEQHTPKADRARKSLNALNRFHLDNCLVVDRFLLDKGLVKY